MSLATYGGKKIGYHNLQFQKFSFLSRGKKEVSSAWCVLMDFLPIKENMAG